MAEDAERTDDMADEEEQPDLDEIDEEEKAEEEPHIDKAPRISLKNPLGLIFNTRMLRRVVQLLFFVGINIYLFAAWFGGEQIIAFWEGVRDFLPSIPIIAPLEGSFAVLAGTFDTLQLELTGGVFPFFTIGAMIIILTILGRSACGWICPIGTVQDFASLPNRHKVRPAPGTEKELRRIKAYIFVLVGFLAAWVGISTVLGNEDALVNILGPFADGAFDPFNPAYIIFTEFANQNWPTGLETLWYVTQWEWFIVQFAFVALIVIVSFWVPRWFCRWLCPAGWLYGVFSRAALFSIGRNPARCTPDTCNVCEMVCPMNIRIRRFPYQHMHSADCILCLDCRSHCPNNAIVIRFS
ncbi:MAG: 4Fe-4S binding protein [Candidatus Thorarchaeota archaeon]|jgi:polyferredoxin